MKSILRVVIVAMLFIGCDPIKNVSEDDRLKLYNNALDQIVTENYFQHCIDFGQRIESIQGDFLQGKIDSLEYLAIRDSLASARRNMIPKCKLNYVDEFQILTAGHTLNNNIKLSIAESLEDDFVSNFTNGPINAIVDTLLLTARLNANNLKISYLEITPYTKRQHRPYGDGIGVICFSQVYFNVKADKAILFYEFNCGPKCGAGEILFLQRANETWKIIKYKRVWDS